MSRTGSLTRGFTGRRCGLRLIMCSTKVHVTTTKAVRVSLLADAVRREAFAEASGLRGEFHECPTARRDELFEPAHAVPCADGALKSRRASREGRTAVPGTPRTSDRRARQFESFRTWVRLSLRSETTRRRPGPSLNPVFEMLERWKPGYLSILLRNFSLGPDLCLSSVPGTRFCGGRPCPTRDSSVRSGWLASSRR